MYGHVYVLLMCSHQLQSKVSEYALVYFHKGKEKIILVMK